MPRSRFQPPDRLQGATAFAKDELGPIDIVRLLRSQRWIWDELRTVCDLSEHWGSPRTEGHWELAAVAFVASGHIDIQPWWAQSTDDLWRACGFTAGRPPYKTTYRRLTELEQVAGAFLEHGVGPLVRRARAHDPRVGAHVHFDSTEDETHAALIHDCQPEEDCQAPRGHSCGRGRAGAGRRPDRVRTDKVREERQALADEEPPEDDEDERLHPPERVQFVERAGRRLKRIMIGGCWYRTTDTQGGIRAYMGPRGARRFWHGYYNLKAVDHFSGGTIHPGIWNASRQECNLFPRSYDAVKELMGAVPQTAIADKGFSVASVFEHCTTNGTAPVIPWRKNPGGDGQRHDEDTHDRHGIPRCKHCGAETEFVRFSATAPGGPRLWVRCKLPVTEACEREQTIRCRENWRLLVPLWRDDPLYHELRLSHQTYESVHDWWRDRYRVGADTLANRPKRRSIGWHRLRANVAAMIEWLRITEREGWLGSARRNGREANRAFQDAARNIAARFRATRTRFGLTIPYGERAVALSIGQRTPPSRRPRGPNGQVTLDFED